MSIITEYTCTCIGVFVYIHVVCLHKYYEYHCQRSKMSTYFITSWFYVVVTIQESVTCMHLGIGRREKSLPVESYWVI